MNNKTNYGVQCDSVFVAIRYGRMPEAEKRKLVAGLLAGEKSSQTSSGSDLKSLAKRVNNAYLKNLNMTKKKARNILTGKTNASPVTCSRKSSVKQPCQ